MDSYIGSCSDMDLPSANCTQIFFHHLHAVRHARVDALHVVLEGEFPIAPLFQLIVPRVWLEDVRGLQMPGPCSRALTHAQPLQGL